MSRSFPNMIWTPKHRTSVWRLQRSRWGALWHILNKCFIATTHCKRSNKIDTQPVQYCAQPMRNQSTRTRNLPRKSYREKPMLQQHLRSFQKDDSRQGSFVVPESNEPARPALFQRSQPQIRRMKFIHMNCNRSRDSHAVTEKKKIKQEEFCF